MLLDRMVHLLSRGSAIPVVQYVRKCSEQQDVDISLIRHFVTEVISHLCNVYYCQQFRFFICVWVLVMSLIYYLFIYLFIYQHRNSNSFLFSGVFFRLSFKIFFFNFTEKFIHTHVPLKLSPLNPCLSQCLKIRSSEFDAENQINLM